MSWKQWNDQKSTGNTANYYPQIMQSSDLAGFDAMKMSAEHKKVIRPKHVPTEKTAERLFNEEYQIPAGPLFNENFGNANDSDIAISGGDGTPINIVNSFALCKFQPEVERNIQRRNYHVPTQIQKAVIPLIQSNNNFDMMAHAHTGTGKSAAFLLPLIDHVQKMYSGGQTRYNVDSPYAIVVAPTRELVRQLYDDAKALSNGTSVTVALAYGDIPMGVSIRNLREGCDLMVTTIGRMLHYVKDSIIKLHNLRFLVLDEGDKFLNHDYALDELKEVYALIRNSNAVLRTLMFSATFEPDVQELASEFLRPNFHFVRVRGLNQAVNTVSQTVLKVGIYQKKDLLVELLLSKSTQRSKTERPYYKTEKTIVFLNGRRETDRLGIALAYYGFSAITTNSSRTQRQRDAAQENFTTGKYDILVSSDVCSRGLNFPNVEHVVNYDMPRENQSGQYIHRIGRTGRAGNIGRSTTFFNPFLDMMHVEFLHHVLENSHQIIPDWLEDMMQANRGIRSANLRMTTMENGFGHGGEGTSSALVDEHLQRLEEAEGADDLDFW